MIDTTKVFLELSLYKPLALEPAAILRVEFFARSINAHCPQCGEESVFRTDRIQSGELTGPKKQRPHSVILPGKAGVCSSLFKVEQGGESATRYASSDHFFPVEFYCTRVHDHRMLFCFAVADGKLIKVGQYPSISDLHADKTKRYRKVLSSEAAGEYARAIGLYSHDIGIGSFVYLRRIVEGLIAEAHGVALSSESWDDPEFKQKRVAEKMKSLRGFVPDFLLDNAGIYSALSRGVHELTEEECLQQFPVLLNAIELVLEEKIAHSEAERRKKAIKKALSEIQSRRGEEIPTQKRVAGDLAV